MPDKAVYLTKEGLEKLKQELDYLKTTKREEVRQRIKEAREFGDISESSEYESAKNEQSFVEGRISELEQMIKGAVIIEENSHHATAIHGVHLGSKVVVESKEGKEEFVIVGPAEADPETGRISNESPIGKGLLGHSAGDVVKIQTPGGEVEYKVIKVS